MGMRGGKGEPRAHVAGEKLQLTVSLIFHAPSYICHWKVVGH